MRIIHLLAAAAGAMSLAGPALAKDHGQGNGRGHGNGHGGWHGDAGYGCPPGLAKKHNGCMPPGQARKMYWNQGAYVPRDYNGWTRYSSIPNRYRSRVPYNSDYRYVYRDNYVYVVDPRTRLVRDVIDLLLR